MATFLPRLGDWLWRSLISDLWSFAEFIETNRPCCGHIQTLAALLWHTKPLTKLQCFRSPWRLQQKSSGNVHIVLCNVMIMSCHVFLVCSLNDVEALLETCNLMWFGVGWLMYIGFSTSSCKIDMIAPHVWEDMTRAQDPPGNQARQWRKSSSTSEVKVKPKVETKVDTRPCTIKMLAHT